VSSKVLDIRRYVLKNVAGYQTSVLSSQPVAVHFQLQQTVLLRKRDRLKIDVSESEAMYSEGVQQFRDGALPPGETSPGLFVQTRHSLHRQGDSSRDQIACSQFDTTTTPAKLQIYKTLIHPDRFSPSSHSLSSSPLFSTFILFISITIINIYFFFRRLIFHPSSVSSPFCFFSLHYHQYYHHFRHHKYQSS